MHYNEENKVCYFLIIDIVKVLTGSNNIRHYWFKIIFIVNGMSLILKQHIFKYITLKLKTSQLVRFFVGATGVEPVTPCL